MHSLPPAIVHWFSERGWAVRPHQLAMLEAARAGDHALLLAATGSGKTLAGFLPVLADAADGRPAVGCRAIYVSPLKALAADIARNLMGPVADMGLPLRIETRTGDDSSERKARQRGDPPDILLTTPESLSLLLSYPDARPMLAGVETLIIDEIHAFANSKRGDLLTLAAAHMQALNPALRRVGLSATVADGPATAHWLTGATARPHSSGMSSQPHASGMSSQPHASGVSTQPHASGVSTRIIRTTDAVPADIRILVPDGRIPWSGHNGRHAAKEVVELIRRHRQTIVFVNSRALAELMFRALWSVNDEALPIGIHHGSLAAGARAKTEAALASGRLRAVVATSSLDLGIDWGDVDLVVQMGAPKGASRLIQRTGRSNHRMDAASKAIIVPGNRFEYLEALAAHDAVAEGELDHEPFRPGGLDVLAQHMVGLAAAAPFDADALFDEVRTAAPYAGLERAAFDRLLAFVSDGGYALRAYDRFRRLRLAADGLWHLTHPRLAGQHRLNAGVIVEAPMMAVRLGRGKALGQVEEWFASQLRVGDRFIFAGLTLELTGTSQTDLFVRPGRGEPSVPAYVGGRMPLTTNLAARVRRMIADPAHWARMPQPVREWLDMQQRLSILPPADRLLVELFPRDDRQWMVIYGFEGRNAHQSLGMLLTSRMERLGLKPLGFVATDYVLGVWSVEPVPDPAPLLSRDIMADELEQWIRTTPFLRRAFRDVAVVSGLVERQQPGRRKSGRAMLASTDLIFDVLARHEPGHLLMDAAWTEARGRLTDIARLESLLARAGTQMLVQRLAKVSPLAVPVLLEVGREGVSDATDAALLAELVAETAAG